MGQLKKQLVMTLKPNWISNHIKWKGSKHLNEKSEVITLAKISKTQLYATCS